MTWSVTVINVLTLQHHSLSLTSWNRTISVIYQHDWVLSSSGRDGVSSHELLEGGTGYEAGWSLNNNKQKLDDKKLCASFDSNITTYVWSHWIISWTLGSPQSTVNDLLTERYSTVHSAVRRIRCPNPVGILTDSIRGASTVACALYCCGPRTLQVMNCDAIEVHKLSTMRS